MSTPINRRKFIAGTSFSAFGIVMGGNITGISSGNNNKPVSSYDLMKDVMKYRKIDAHCHPEQDLARQIEMADRLGIEKIQISNPVTNFSGNEPEGPEEVRKNNDVVCRAMKQYPGRFIGFFTLNPAYTKESLEEIKRCVDMGMAGYKGYIQVKVNDPLYYPIIEKLIDLKMIVYMHTFCQMGIGGYRMKYDTGRFPNTTLPEDMVDAATRYPEATFHFAHIGGGGDWEYECKILMDHPNIYVDTGGSNNEENMIDFAIKHLGEDRIFFGTDNCYHHGVGKILASNATDAQKRKIFYENYMNVLRKGGRYAD
ncbi:MAG: amidohydrolase family protein [Bacteroidales bacterium]|jgi:predicted TIM-barrel fold metal-dependent hydrolase|nr:amidohydrolase family protein [Bacteroidales bacterium]